MPRSLKLALAAGVCGLVTVALWAAAPITVEDVRAAAKLIGLELSEAKRDSMLTGLQEQLTSYEHIRAVRLANAVPPALSFNPIPRGFSFAQTRKPFRLLPRKGIAPWPADTSALPFYSLRQLGELLRTRKVTSVQLTHMYLERLRKYGPKLQCVITLTEETALREAEAADRDIAAGRYRGPLHGIPYGVKDLLATRGYGTTWGSAAYRDQVIDEDATVVTRLRQAGAVLVAKLTMGELAWGDVWFGGMTRNPWNPEQGSSGSSAGSAAATSAGLVGFAIGTETWGSIVSPSTRCGVSGLRPTYGRVSRSGAMALSWSMDKIGPICRTVEDCAIVFRAICGPDGSDQTLYDAPFNYDGRIDWAKARVGVLARDFDSVKENRANNDSTLAVLRRLGARLVPVELPAYPTGDLSIILSAEAGAAFDELTRTGRDSLLVRQIKDAWPNVFRLSRFIPAVEYLQANRVRYLVIQDMQRLMEKVDLYVAPSFEGDNLLLTNLTGHPCVVVPNGFDAKGSPTSICFIGRLFDEATVLAAAQSYQEATTFHLRHPKLD